MKLPDLSYMMSVAELRYIQSRFETGEYHNPDSLVGAFLTPAKRLRCMLRGTILISRVRSNPFYSYVVARTKCYDEIFLAAIYRPSRCIVNIGCGSDTRAHRFGHLLKQRRIDVLECDQAEAISAKQYVAEAAWPNDQIAYIPVDLNRYEGDWPDFVARLSEYRQAPVLVMLEGVSPYINMGAFEAFLRVLANNLWSGSVVAYDFKLAGVADDFGRSDESQRLFRLSGNEQEVANYHRSLGYDLKWMELSSSLSRRLLPRVEPVFEEDCLVQLSLR
jgi:methyltransferase (TIGR00027 family)